MTLIPPSAWRTWLLAGVAIGLLALIAYKAAERYLWVDAPASNSRTAVNPGSN
jgi:hypothetical protein